MATDGGAGFSAQEVESRILAFVRQELLGPETSVDRYDELLSDGTLDSVAVLRLVDFLEKEFRLKIQPSDFLIENFKNVAVLADYVRRSSSR